MPGSLKKTVALIRANDGRPINDRSPSQPLRNWKLEGRVAGWLIASLRVDDVTQDAAHQIARAFGFIERCDAIEYDGQQLVGTHWF